MFMIKSPTGMLVIVAFVLVILTLRRRKRKISSRVTEMEYKAASMDMTYSAPVSSNGDITVMSDGESVTINEGTHTFTGTNNGIPWVIKSLMLKDVDFESSHARRTMGPQYTRWSTVKVRSSGGSYIMLMDLRDKAGKETFSKPQPPASGGMFAGIVNKAAGMVLGYFISSYFGNAQAKKISAEPGHRFYPESAKLGERYAVFSSDHELAKRILSVGVEEYLLGDNRFRPSVMINAEGIMCSCPTYMISSDEIKSLAEFGSVLALKIEEAISV